MAVTWLWCRTDLRHSIRSVVVLALLVALSTATVLSALAGARRGDSALDRLVDATLPATAAVLPNTPGFDWGQVERLPEVEALTGFAVDYAIGVEGLPPEVVAFPPTDGNTFTTVERPVLQRGRVFDPHRADEVVVTRGFVEHFGLDVGDRVTLELPTAEERAAASPGSLSGPRVGATIVGVVLSPWFGDSVGSDGALIPSPGLAQQYPDLVVGDQSDPSGFAVVNALVRLRGGEEALPAFRRDLAAVTHRDIDVWNLPQQYRVYQRTIRFEAVCQLVFALVALAAAALLVGQGISRHTSAAVEELRKAQMLGMSGSEAAWNASLLPSAAGAVGALLALPVSYVASGRFPLGVAGLTEPHPGPNLDWVVLGPGLVVTVGLVVLMARLSAGHALRLPARSGRRSAFYDLVGGGPWSVPVAIGTRFALDPGRGRASVPVRRAIFGAVVGLVGITGAITFSAAVHDAASSPQRFGQTFNMAAMVGYNGNDDGPVGELVSALTSRPEVDGVLRGRMGVVSDPAGRSSVSLYDYEGGDKPLGVVMVSGRMAVAADEVVLAPRSLGSLHAEVGDRVTLVGDRGESTFLVTGVGFVPAGSHNSYADGGWVTGAGYDRVLSGFKFDTVFIDARAGTSPEDLTAALVASDPSLAGLEISRPDPLEEIAILRNVESLPAALGLFMVLLAVAAVGHALATSVRRRSGDLAVMMALGMTPRQCRSVVVTQSTVLALVGLLLGLPLGVALGRIAWRVVAGYTPLAYVGPFPSLALLVTVPAALLAVNLLGAWPGRRAAHLRVNHVLRAE